MSVNNKAVNREPSLKTADAVAASPRPLPTSLLEDHGAVLCARTETPQRATRPKPEDPITGSKVAGVKKILSPPRNSSTAEADHHVVASTSVQERGTTAGGGTKRSLSSSAIFEASSCSTTPSSTSAADVESAQNKFDINALLTPVIVTSPIKSQPSTEMLEQTAYSFFRACPDYKRQIVVACDGYYVKDNVNENKRCYGAVSAAQAERYEAYMEKLENHPDLAKFFKVLRPESRSRPDVDGNGVVEPDVARKMTAKNSSYSSSHVGFAWTLQRAIRELVPTKLVMVLPHDVRFDDKFNGEKICQACDLIMRTTSTGDHGCDVPLQEVVNKDCSRVLTQHRPKINYVGFLSGRTANLQQRYWEKAGLYLQKQVEIAFPGEGTRAKPVDLQPLPIWKENPHIASVAKYEEFIFSGKFKRIKRGQFIEETVGQEMLSQMKALAASGTDEGKHKARELHRNHFGCYLLCDDEVAATRHLDGRCYVPVQERKERGWVVDDADFVEDCTRHFYGRGTPVIVAGAKNADGEVHTESPSMRSACIVGNEAADQEQVEDENQNPREIEDESTDNITV
ncbi:unnamed protein product [Amoebophrya sp. A120]|nr:unnamed protein product [Amoebophrya sp. A120]|eukprot:GSA120T00021425001.1